MRISDWSSDVCSSDLFALDRLLLGHASGSDAPITAASGHVIAPMPELEGSALDALDTLVRLLRVLARHARALDEALSPDGWRERLLGLLEDRKSTRLNSSH